MEPPPLPPPLPPPPLPPPPLASLSSRLGPGLPCGVGAPAASAAVDPPIGVHGAVQWAASAAVVGSGGGSGGGGGGSLPRLFCAPTPGRPPGCTAAPPSVGWHLVGGSGGGSLAGTYVDAPLSVLAPSTNGRRREGGGAMSGAADAGLVSDAPPPAVVAASRPPSAAVSAASGGLSGIVATVLTQPLDVAKTRLQLQRSTPGVADKYRGVVHTLRTVAAEEGMRGLMRGVSPSILGLTPSLSLFFTTYNWWRARLAALPLLDGQTPPPLTGDSALVGMVRRSPDVLINGVAAAASWTSTCIITNPIWIVRLRMMAASGVEGVAVGSAAAASGAASAAAPPTAAATAAAAATSATSTATTSDGRPHTSCSPPRSSSLPSSRPPRILGGKYNGLFQSTRLIIREEGIAGLWHGTAASCLSAPGAALQFCIYERLKLPSAADAAAGRVAPATQVAAASAASSVATTLVFYPLEVLRSRTQAALRGKTPPMATLAREMWRTEGAAAFYKGITASLVRTVPNGAMALCSYEFFVRILSQLVDERAAQ